MKICVYFLFVQKSHRSGFENTANATMLLIGIVRPLGPMAGNEPIGWRRARGVCGCVVTPQVTALMCTVPFTAPLTRPFTVLDIVPCTVPVYDTAQFTVPCTPRSTEPFVVY